MLRHWLEPCQFDQYRRLELTNRNWPRRKMKMDDNDRYSSSSLSSSLSIVVLRFFLSTENDTLSIYQNLISVWSVGERQRKESRSGTGWCHAELTLFFSLSLSSFVSSFFSLLFIYRRYSLIFGRFSCSLRPNVEDGWKENGQEEDEEEEEDFAQLNSTQFYSKMQLICINSIRHSLI